MDLEQAAKKTSENINTSRTTDSSIHQSASSTFNTRIEIPERSSRIQQFNQFMSCMDTLTDIQQDIFMDDILWNVI